MHRQVAAKAAQLLRDSLPLGRAAATAAGKDFVPTASGVSAATAAQIGEGLQQPRLSLRGLASLAATASRSAGAVRAACQPSAACSRAGQLGAALQKAAAGQAVQQARGLRYLSFQPRGSGRWGSPDWDAGKVVWGLIASNGAVFLLWRSDPRFCWRNFTVSIDSLRQGRIHTALTAAFSHKDFTHFAANMIGLYFFAGDVGRLFGGKKLLGLYLLGGVVGSLAHCGWYYYQASKHSQTTFGRSTFLSYAPPALGASAAVNAVMLTDILLYPTRTILLYGIIPMPAALLGVLWLLRDVTGTLEGKGHIAHAGHLGGAATGLLFYTLYRLGRIRTRGWY